MTGAGGVQSDAVLLISEAAGRALVSMEDAIACGERALAAVGHPSSKIFPALRAHGSDAGNRFGVKAALSPTAGPGAKLGSYWPSNPSRGLAAHGSTTLLLDDETGRLRAVVMASHLNALRTAAADAVAVKYLARPGAARLALIGTGNQAYFDALAISVVRALEIVMVCGRDNAAARRLSERLQAVGLDAVAMTVDEALPQADIVATVTAARQPLFDGRLVRPGTHISAMGADGPGKQELPVDLVRRATLFADWPQQSVEIGEFQHIAGVDPRQAAAIRPLAGVIAAQGYERRDGEITIFDSSGVALQDLEIASLAMRLAVEANAAIEMPDGST